MWAKPWGKRLLGVNAHWALLYHLLHIYVTGAWLTWQLLHSYRSQTAALRFYEKTQIYIKRSIRLTNILYNPIIMTETDTKYEINPQHLSPSPSKMKEIKVSRVHLDKRTHVCDKGKCMWESGCSQFWIWEMCFHFQYVGLGITNKYNKLTQIFCGRNMI